MPNTAVLLLLVLPLSAALRRPAETHAVDMSGLGKHMPRAFAMEGGPTVRFIHIPKTGGTSIELDSLEEYGDSEHPNNQTWGKMDTTLLGQGDCRPGHKTPLCYSEVAGSKCSNWHIPPKFMPDGGAHFQGTINLCVIRNPFDRVVSQYKWTYGSCDKEALNEKVAQVLTAALKVRENGGVYAEEDCHWIPQSMFLEKGSDPGCNKLIFMDRGEGLVSNFNEMVKQLGVQGHLDTHAYASSCSLSADDLSHETNALIMQYFRDDLQEWPFYEK